MNNKNCEKKDSIWRWGWCRLKKNYIAPVTVIALIINVLVLIFVGINFRMVAETSTRTETVDFNEGWYLIRDDGTGEEITLPYDGESFEGETICIANDLTEDMRGQTLSFASENQRMMVYVDGELIYSYGAKQRDIDDGWFNTYESTQSTDGSEAETEAADETDITKSDVGSSSKENRDEAVQELISKLDANNLYTGETQHFIVIPTDFEYGYIEIVISSYKKNAAATIESMTVGPAQTAIVSLMAGNVPNIVCAIASMLAAFMLILLAIIQFCSGQNASGMLCLAFFLVDAGLYYILKSSFISMFTTSDVFTSYMACACLTMMPFFLALYFDRRFV